MDRDEAVEERVGTLVWLEEELEGHKDAKGLKGNQVVEMVGPMLKREA